jgi:hypothetical protein
VIHTPPVLWTSGSPGNMISTEPELIVVIATEALCNRNGRGLPAPKEAHQGPSPMCLVEAVHWSPRIGTAGDGG